MLGNIWKAHNSSPWQNNFINGIQIHNQNPWFKPMAIYLFKTQFSLTILKPNSHWQHLNSILIGNIKSQNPILIGNIKNPILIGNIKSPTYVGIIYWKPKFINTWQNTIS